MKTASSELFDLIHSLSSRERAYFKRFAGMHKQSSDSNYLRVFDAIYEQKQYDEKALKEQFKNDKLSSYFARVKKYLYDKILESMRLFHSEVSISAQLKLQINSARFLYSKRLFKQALKKAQQIKKEAEEAEYWAEYLAATEIETSILARIGYKGVNYKDLTEFHREGMAALKKYREVYRHYFLERQMTYLLGRGALSDKKETAHIFQEVLSDDNLTGVSGKIQRLYTLALYSEHHSNEPQNAIQYYNEAVVLMEDKPVILQKGTDMYLFFVGRLLELSLYQTSFDRYQQYLQKIKEYLLENELLWHKQKEFRFIIQAEYYYYSLLALFEFGKHCQTISMLKEASSKLQSQLHEIHPAYQMRLPYIAMFIHFFHHQYDKALQYANAVLEVGIDFHPMKERVKLWLLFIHWELKSDDLLEYLIRNTVRYWRKKDLYDDSKRFLVGMLQKLMGCICEKAIWSDICKKLEPPTGGLPKGKSNRRWYIYAMSKLEGKTMSETHLQLLTESKTSNEVNLITEENLHLTL